MIVTINGVECEPGCWVDGHWGQYGPDHLADKVDNIIDIAPDDDPRVLRQTADALAERYGHQIEPICAVCEMSCVYRDEHGRWFHVARYPTAGIRLELEHVGHAPKLTWPMANAWEAFHDATQRIVDRLNDATPDGWIWDWVDGEFFLMPICDDEENCTDETCAHWAYC